MIIFLSSYMWKIYENLENPEIHIMRHCILSNSYLSRVNYNQRSHCRIRWGDHGYLLLEKNATNLCGIYSASFTIQRET